MATVSDGWVQSSTCESAACLQVKRWAKAVEIRSTSDPLERSLFASPQEWAALVEGVKAGDFDDV